MIPPDALTRLSNLCAQLSSTYEAICFVAAQKTTKLLAEHGLTWREMVDRAFVTKMETFKPGGDLALYQRVLRWHGLSSWEREFVTSLHHRYPKPLTDKQKIHWEKIVVKFNARGTW